MKSRQRNILLVEDNFSSILLVERALSQLNSSVSLQITRDGEQGKHYLEGTGQYGDRQRYPFPDMVLSNTRMPRINGIELLAWIKQQPEFLDLPVVMMSSSEDPTEMAHVMKLGAIAYFAKPFRLEALVVAIKNVLSFLPPDSETN